MPLMAPHTFIVEHGQVLERFGEWPSFHDGEVHRLLLDSTRTKPDGGRYSSIELEVRGWIMTRDITEQGFYRRAADSVVRFLFEDVSLVKLDGFNQQNVLSCLAFELLRQDNGSPLLKVELEHCFGLSGSFFAAAAKVLSVTPYDALRPA